MPSSIFPAIYPQQTKKIVNHLSLKPGVISISYKKTRESLGPVVTIDDTFHASACNRSLSAFVAIGASVGLYGSG